MTSYTVPVALEARRRLCTVVVDGLDSLGLHLAQHLVQLRLGAVILRDENPVADQDAGFRTIDNGRPRAEAAAELLDLRRQSTCVLEAPEGAAVSGADLHIVTGQGSLPMESLRRAVTESSAVLPVVAASTGWQIGPLLLHDSPVCVDCLDAIGVLTPDSGPDAELSTVHTAAAVAAEQAKVLVDGQQKCVMEQAALVFESPTGMIAPAAFQPRPDCPCLIQVGPHAPTNPAVSVGL